MTKDITNQIEAFAALYVDGKDDDGEVAGIYPTRSDAKIAHRGEATLIIRLIPANPVIINA